MCQCIDKTSCILANPAYQNMYIVFSNRIVPITEFGWMSFNVAPFYGNAISQVDERNERIGENDWGVYEDSGRVGGFIDKIAAYFGRLMHKTTTAMDSSLICINIELIGAEIS